MLVYGSAVQNPGTENTNLVHCVDLYSTILELCGLDVSTIPQATNIIDSTSLVPILDGGHSSRSYALVELFETGGSNNVRAIRDSRYQLVAWENGAEEFYDVLLDPYQATNMLPILSVPEQARYDDLQNQLLLLQ